ncbi:MAG TPA: helix-turn-helix transcriptional regulator [Nocardioides sp.]|nr:helix-turn-helix transcriptional regulator [Nocardioides sp.]HRI97663.1 helix-turn-helix transcriptional regulator [Nocardioides sp.]
MRHEVVQAGLVDEQRAEDARKEMIEKVRAHRLSEIRRAQHITQVELAHRMHVSQPRVSAIERGALSSTEVGTLAAYVEALGGTFRLVADFGDESLVIG